MSDDVVPLDVFVARYTGAEPRAIATVSQREDEARRVIQQIRADAWREAAAFLGVQRNLDDDVVPGVQLAVSVLRWRADQIENGDDDE